MERVEEPAWGEHKQIRLGHRWSYEAKYGPAVRNRRRDRHAQAETLVARLTIVGSSRRMSS